MQQQWKYCYKLPSLHILLDSMTLKSRIKALFFFQFSQALPIFLDSLVSAWGAILMSVTLILMFGEVSYYESFYNEHDQLKVTNKVLNIGHADYTPSCLFKVWFGNWCSSGSICSCSSLPLFPCCIPNKQGTY